MMSGLLRALRQLLRRSGFDVVRYRVGADPRGATRGHGSLGEHLMSVFDRAEIDCVLDVGAHEGQYGRLLRACGYDAHIVSFEPVSANARTLLEHARLDPKWTVMDLALGDTDDEAPIYVTRRSDLASFRQLSTYAKDLWPEGTVIDEVEQVKRRRLDDVLADDLSNWRGRRFFLKIDTQGCEGEVIAGAGEYLTQIFGIQVEASVKPIYEGVTSYLGTLALLEAHGFELTGIFPVTRDADLRIVELDCVMMRSLSSQQPNAVPAHAGRAPLNVQSPIGRTASSS
jgi:FkbM family methyltransferase